MSYASRVGRARVSPSNPQALAVCQRCGVWHNFVDLTWQFDWRGAALQNVRLLVCRECLDQPQQQLRAIVVSADPVPIPFALVEPFVYDEGGNIPAIGQPTGLQQYAISPLNGTTHYGVEVPVLSVTSGGGTTISVTCSTPHGLSTNDQISVEGLTNTHANGFYSVTVTTATAFTYETFGAVNSGALWGAHSRMVTALVGLPYGYTTIPQVGP